MYKAWSNIEEVPYCFSRSSVKFEGHTGNKSSILTRIEGFRTVTLVWIHQWLWNDAQSLMYHRRGSLLFFKVIHWMSRSHGEKNRRFWHELSVSGQQLQFEFTEGFDIMHKALFNVEEVSYNFSRSSIKFQGHMAEKSMICIQFEVRLLGRSQLSNPSDLPCFSCVHFYIVMRYFMRGSPNAYIVHCCVY